METNSFNQIIIQYKDGKSETINMKEIENISFVYYDENQQANKNKARRRLIYILLEKAVADSEWHRSSAVHYIIYIASSEKSRDEIIAKIEDCNQYRNKPHTYNKINHKCALNKGYLFYRFSTQFNEPQGIIGVCPTLEMAQELEKSETISCKVSKAVKFTVENPNCSEEIKVINYRHPEVNVIMVQDMIVPFDFT